ncbi:hypothetical protein [Mucilaginibacter terrae]|uniref:Uncharacterized protein n=1 Tax=Mucilaginibacter terrae TaxID=1955052 RepID=A0ABU3GWY4_9SPHI|nr:hypothetical protein [Mucilaginibacter terrae]MDT3404126.1 hypothetical protein [Mucilaginibacter terrae]
MLKTTNGISLTANAVQQPIMKNILRSLIHAITHIWKPTPNQFNKRYAEKFTKPDHCQWQGGRLLSQRELDEYNNRQKI